MKSQVIHINLRISPELHKLLVKSAAKHKQSLNSQINSLLSQSLGAESVTERAERRVRELADTIATLEEKMALAEEVSARLERATAKK
jgi:hypothetical protein